MGKKLEKRTIILMVILIGGLIIGFWKFAQYFNQVKLQYDDEVISNLKNPLDFSPFEKAMSQIGEARFNQIDQMTRGETIEKTQALILAKQLTCEEMLLYYINQIQKHDTYYNTVICLNPKALIYARQLDDKIQKGEPLGQLLGVMILAKDNISDADMPTTAGSYALRDLRTKRDAFVISQLKAQDAIIIGKNNLSEWANFMSMPSSNGFSVMGGQSKNAYGKFDVGGSSSGSCASVALNFATVALGTETAGSLIYPAGQNSVVAIKPTIGLISRDLVIPITEAQDTVGVISRNVADVEKVMQYTSGYDAKDKETELIQKAEKPKALPSQADLKGIRIGVYRKTAQKGIAQEMIALGAEVVEINLFGDPDRIDYLPILKYGIVNDVNAYLNNPAVESPFKSLEAIIAYCKEDEANRMPYGAALQEAALTQIMTKEDYEALAAKNKRIARKIIDETMKRYKLDAILSTSNELSNIYAPANYPAVTLPAGYTRKGEPFGLTLVGGRLSDENLLKIAGIYEKQTKHRVEPKVK